MLRARIFEKQLQKQLEQRAETVKGLIGTGDRSERIRTYNFQQARFHEYYRDERPVQQTRHCDVVGDLVLGLRERRSPLRCRGRREG